MDLGRLLLHYGFVKTMEEAERLCERGCVHIDGKAVSNVQHIPETGSYLSSLEHDYIILVPVRKQYETLSAPC